MKRIATLAILIAPALLGLSLDSPGWAQDPSAPATPAPSPPPRPKAPRAEGDASPAPAQARRALLNKQVGLDDAKAARVEAVVRKYAGEQRAIRQSMRQTRNKLRGLLRSDSNDQQAYRATLAEMEKAQKALAELRQKRFDELEAVLTPKEQAKLLETMGKVNKQMRARRGDRGKLKRPRFKRPKPQRGELKDPFGGR